MVVGFCGCVLALIIYKFGSDWIDIVLPPAAMGPVVALIGLELSGNAASNAGLLDEVIAPANVIVFLVTLGVAVFGNIVFRGFWSVIPILIAVIAGYVAALACGIVVLRRLPLQPWFAIPNFRHRIQCGGMSPYCRLYWLLRRSISDIRSLRAKLSAGIY